MTTKDLIDMLRFYASRQGAGIHDSAEVLGGALDQAATALEALAVELAAAKADAAGAKEQP